MRGSNEDCLPMKGHPRADLEIVQSVSGNLNVFTEKCLRKEGIYWVKNA